MRAAWPAIAWYAALRGISLLVLWLAASDQNRSLLTILGKYDAIWYARIVTNGYDHVIPLKPDGGLATTNLAFFPLYPGLTALADFVLPGGARTAGIAVAWLAGLAAAWGLYALGAHLRDRRTGVILAALWAVVPHGLVQSMGYTETLFTALAAWSLFALLRGHWVTAGLLCTLAGLTRPTGAALVATVGLAALIAVVRRRDGWRPWAAGALAPLGLLGFVAWVGHRLGRADGYFHVQNDAWKMSYDTGAFTLKTVYSGLTKAMPLAFYVTMLILVIAVALLAVLAFDRAPWPLVLYAGLVVAMVFFGDGYFHAKARLLLPAFPLLLPIAFALAGARRRVTVVVLAAMTAVSAAYGVYLAIAWTYSP
ncbi:glycosyltransferase family 39 protein [Actinoplanes sp. NEAU-A11]|uniref:Glycosyltransferase family 39 protein n=2 Tax=Actinoplanes aureus TaxID=2792083 RepID=A0A931CKA2_9ACTN|nr:glycosyltransferase family 39 protein [Actinoplanes aureus]